MSRDEPRLVSQLALDMEKAIGVGVFDQCSGCGLQLCGLGSTQRTGISFEWMWRGGPNVGCVLPAFPVADQSGHVTRQVLIMRMDTNFSLKVFHSRTSRLGCVLLFGSVASAFSLRADTVTFDRYTSPTDNDLVNLFNLTGSLTQSTEGGISGGAVVASGLPETPMYLQGFNPLDDLTTSIFVRYDLANSGDPGQTAFSARAGFGGSALEGLSVSSPSAYFWGEFANNGELSVWSRDSGNGDGYNLLNTSVQASPGNWLKLTFSEMYLGNNEFRLSATLENYGELGTAPPALLGAGSINVVNPAAATDGSVFAGFGGHYNVVAFDNFAVVPEPGAWRLLICGGIAFGGVRLGRILIRRRRYAR